MLATEIRLNEIMNEIKSDQGEKLKLRFLQSVQTGLSWKVGSVQMVLCV